MLQEAFFGDFGVFPTPSPAFLFLLAPTTSATSPSPSELGLRQCVAAARQGRRMQARGPKPGARQEPVSPGAQAGLRDKDKPASG